MTTTIISNGSKWAGEEPDDIETLLSVLQSYALDRTFEAFGNFVELDPINLRGERMTAEGGASFFGNFQTLSHVFNILTDDQELITRLTAAIRANQQRPDYLSQDDYATIKARENEARLKRDSIKQAERERQARATLGMAVQS